MVRPVQPDLVARRPARSRSRPEVRTHAGEQDEEGGGRARLGQHREQPVGDARRRAVVVGEHGRSGRAVAARRRSSLRPASVWPAHRLARIGALAPGLQPGRGSRPWMWQSSRPPLGHGVRRAGRALEHEAGRDRRPGTRRGCATACSSCTRISPRDSNAQRVTASTICRATPRPRADGQDAVADLGDQVVGVDGEQADVADHPAGARGRRRATWRACRRTSRRRRGTTARPRSRGRGSRGPGSRAYVGVVDQLERLRGVLRHRRPDHQVGGLQTLHAVSLGPGRPTAVEQARLDGGPGSRRRAAHRRAAGRSSRRR